MSNTKVRIKLKAYEHRTLDKAAAKIVDEFDPEKFQKVIDFATAANGGRPIGSN